MDFNLANSADPDASSLFAKVTVSFHQIANSEMLSISCPLENQRVVTSNSENINEPRHVISNNVVFWHV